MPFESLTTQLPTVNAIANTDGVDGVFFGPSHLAASMSMLGRPGDPEIQKSIVGGIATVRASGKAAGVLTVDAALARTPGQRFPAPIQRPTLRAQCLSGSAPYCLLLLHSGHAPHHARAPERRPRLRSPRSFKRCQRNRGQSGALNFGFVPAII